MKKKMLLFLLFFIPFMINAEEKCTIVSGNGQDIGSEIACGTEHFYIIENNEDSVRMLAKYNLDIGFEFNKVTISAERYEEIKELCLGSSYCNLMFEEPEFIGYTVVELSYKNDDETYTYLIRRGIEYSEVKQCSKAIGAHGDEKGNPEFPEYGVVKYNRIDEYEYDGEAYGNGTLRDNNIKNLDLWSSDDGLVGIFSDYETYLFKFGVIIENVDILSLKDINEIAFKLTNNYLPLEDWGNEDNWVKVEINEADEFYIVGNIKDYLLDKYSWIYGTTYWTKTFSLNYSYNINLFFVDTLGNICNADACFDSIGAGIRPVVEISKDSINYNLTTKSDKGGTLETDKSHVVGDTIVLNAKPKTGYKLEKLIVTTDSGTTIEVSGEDIVENEDGTISINPEVFTMPLENVVVEAKWAFVNPKTGVSSLIGVMFTLMLISISGFFMIRNCNNSYEL